MNFYNLQQIEFVDESFLNIGAVTAEHIAEVLSVAKGF